MIVLSLEAGFLCAACCAQQRLAIALPLKFEGRDLKVEGEVSGLPVRTDDGLRFAFDITRGASDIKGFPHRVLLQLPARSGILRVEPGESWRFVVRLRRVHRAVNFHAPNVESGMLERGFRATGYIREQAILVRLGRGRRALLERLRFAIRERIEAALLASLHLGIVVALAIGDQSLIGDADRQRFVGTGTGHLIAVSGLHVSLAGALAALVSSAWRRLPGLAGYAVPALRAFAMLATAAVATVAGRELAVSTVLAWALGLVVLLDPWAVLSAGFWLSFGAVAAILFATSGRFRGVAVEAATKIAITRIFRNGRPC